MTLSRRRLLAGIASAPFWQRLSQAAPSQQMLLASGAALPLDPFATGLWGCYSLTRLRASYGGYCLTIRRSSDNATQDIGFVGTAVDTVSLLAFVGANDGFVTKWYDQSGGTNDIAQATTTKQPMLVDAGTYCGELLFDGVDDILTSSNSTNAVTGGTVHFAGRQREAGGAAGRILFTGTCGGIHLQSARSSADASDYRSGAYNDAAETGINAFTDALGMDNTTYSLVVDRAAATLVTQNILYINGTAQSSIQTAGSLVSGSSTASVISISNAGQPARLGVRTFLAYEVAQSSGTVASIAALIRPAANTDGLDSFTTGLWGAYSLRRLRSNYAGPCMRVRRSSDSAEQDIGFNAITHIWDTASLLTFAGAGSAFVKTVYDQSGGTNDLTMGTTANQARVVNSGVLDAGMVFDGSNDCLATGNNSGTPSAFTTFIQGSLSSASNCVVLEQTASVSTHTGYLWEINGGRANASEIITTQTSISNTIRSNFDSMLVGGVAAGRGDRAQGTGAAQATFFNGGAKLTRDSNVDAGTVPSGNFVAGAWNLMARAGSVAPCPGTITAVVIYETAVSDANVERISRALG